MSQINCDFVRSLFPCFSVSQDSDGLFTGRDFGGNYRMHGAGNEGRFLVSIGKKVSEARYSIVVKEFSDSLGSAFEAAAEKFMETEGVLPCFLDQVAEDLGSYPVTGDVDRFMTTLGRMPPNEIADLIVEQKAPKDFDYVLWSNCCTWGFEITWALHHRAENDAYKYDDAPAIEELTPDALLFDHGLWAPQDQLARFG